MYQFGSGTLWGVPTSGNLGPNPAPQKFGTLQDVSVDFSADVKELFGQNQFPDFVARGKMKITGKAKAGRIVGAMFNQLFFGQTQTAGMKSYANDEVHAVPASTPYTVTVTNSAMFSEDLGVRYSATGIQLAKVTSGPTVGQYSEAAGIYTFAAADASAGVLISYNYTSAATGLTVAINNQLMGYAPVFEVHLAGLFNNSQFAIKLFSCVSTKLSIATKQDDFTVPEFDFSAFANAAGQVGELDTGE